MFLRRSPTCNRAGFEDDFKRMKYSQRDKSGTRTIRTNDKLQNTSFIRTARTSRQKGQPSPTLPQTSRCFMKPEGLFWTVVEEDQIPLSVGQSHIICADQVQNIPLRQARSEDSEMSGGGPGPGSRPPPPCTMSIHVRWRWGGNKTRGGGREDSGKFGKYKTSSHRCSVTFIIFHTAHILISN